MSQDRTELILLSHYFSNVMINSTSMKFINIHKYVAQEIGVKQGQLM
jgi:hypothetical protein